MFEVLRGCNVIGYGIFGSMASNSEPPQPPNYDNIEMEGIGSVTLPNSLKAPIERLQLLGNSTQGCTIKVLSTELEQGTINAGNGENFPSNYRVRTKGFSDIQKGKYKVTCEGAKQANIIFYSTDGIYKNTLFKAHTVFPFYFTANEACKIRVEVSNGTEAEAIAIKPENVKSITVATEETPEYPQEIVSCGRKSRNLFNVNDTDDTKCVTTNPNQAFAYDPLYVLSNMIPAKQGQSIVKGNSGSKMCIFLDVNKEPILSTKASVEDGKAIEVPSEAHYFCFNVLKTNLSKNVMCNIGNVLLPYEPYSDKFLFDISVNGKNLFDVDSERDGYINISGTVTGQQGIKNEKYGDYIPINKFFKTVYITAFVTIPTDEAPWVSVAFYDRNKNFIKRDAEQVTYLTAKIPENAFYMVGTYRKYEDGVFQMEYDSVSAKYEPYIEPQTAQLQLDEPLRGIGEYKDVVTKDGILRKIKEIVLDENTGFTNHLGGTQNKTICFVTHILKDATNIAALNNAMSDKIEKVLYVDMNDKECFTLFNKQIYIKLSRERNIDTVEKLKEWLKQNPIKIQYLLQEPVTEQFENSLENLHANNGTTVISVDSGEVETGIKLTYRKEK